MSDSMRDTLTLPEGWTSIRRPPSLFCRYKFETYEDASAFLDRLAELSHQEGLYPDLGFSRTHVNVTLYGANGGMPGAAEIDFASRASGLTLGRHRDGQR